jgi:hypothetical protein
MHSGRILTAVIPLVFDLGAGCAADKTPAKKEAAPPAGSAARPTIPGSGARPGPARPERSKLVEDGIGSDPARVQTEAEAKATGDVECPKYVGKRSTAAQLVGLHARTLPHQDGWAFQFDKGISVFSPTSGQPTQQIPAAEIPKGIIAFDDEAWYVPHCEAGGCGEHGTGVVIDRVDRSTKAATQLVPSQSEIVTAEVMGDYLYWSTFGPYGMTGELRRIKREGGKVETLWKGHGVAAMLLEHDVALVADQTSVVAVPLSGGKPRVLAEKLQEVNAIAADADHIYIAEYGDRYWASPASGYIKRVPRAGGTVETLAGPIKSPSVVAVDDDRAYYMLSDSGTVWSIVKTGTEQPTMIVPQPPRDATCQRSMWLRADQTGLIWFRKVEGFGKGNLWRLSRQYLPPPPDTAVAAFRRWMEANPDASQSGSSSAGSAAGEPDPDD